MGNVFCNFLIDGDPIENEEYNNKFRVNMMDAPCADCNSACCFISSWCCWPFTQYIIRKKALHDNINEYKCFQGYLDCPPYYIAEQTRCPRFCLACESIWCPCIAISATRMLVMDTYQLQSDNCDRRLIRINNCCVLSACICHIIYSITGICGQGAHYCSRLTNILYCCVQGCMTSQVNYELEMEKAESEAEDGPNAPNIIHI